MKELNEMPSAKIALKRNVVKTYEVDGVKSVFLKDGSEFEIELFNPTQRVILAKIKLNGEFINGGGLILNPGKRVFLERYLDNDVKFKYSTYKVENNNPVVDYAIKNNGLVEILFYYNIGNSSVTTYTSPYYNYTIDYTKFNTFNFNPNILRNSDFFAKDWDSSINFLGSLTAGTLDASGTLTTSTYNIKEEKETGRVEEGSKSNQPLTNASMYFSSTPFHQVNIKILPEGEKIYNTEDFKYRKYCQECGNKVKPNDKYCSHCGHKL